jgi:integrase
VVKSTRRSSVVALSVLWKDRPIASITPDEIIQAVADVRRRAPIHANRVFAYTRAAFRFALKKRWLDTTPCSAAGEPVVDLTIERARERVLSDDEIRRLWAALDAETPVIGDVIRVLLLTAQRSGEVFGMKVVGDHVRWLVDGAIGSDEERKRAPRVPHEAGTRHSRTSPHEAPGL